MGVYSEKWVSTVKRNFRGNPLFVPGTTVYRVVSCVANPIDACLSFLGGHSLGNHSLHVLSSSGILKQ